MTPRASMRPLWVAGWTCASILSFLPIFSAVGAAGASWPAVALMVAVATLASWRPDVALASIAAAIPVAQWISRGSNTRIQWPDAIILSFVAGIAVHRALYPAPQSRDRAVLRAAGLGAVIVASLLLDLSLQLHLDPGLTVMNVLSSVRDGLLTGGSSSAAAAASMLMRGLVLFVSAAWCIRTYPSFRMLLARAVVIGAAAAAAVTVARLIVSAWRFADYWTVLARYLTTLRFNVHYGDLNAAGSYFVLTLFLAIALALDARGVRRLGWMSCVVAIAMGLWLSGSRTAIVSGVIALGILLPVSFFGHSVRQNRKVIIGTALAGIVAALVVAVAIALFLPARKDQAASSIALQIRLELTKTSLRLIAAHPAFGIGVGRYQARSGEFVSPELVALFPVALNENAHNNYLQVAAELGLIGFVVFIWVLWLPARRLTAIPLTLRDPLPFGIALGLTAHLCTWLGGHPLLIPEVAYSFWLVLGAAVGWPYTANRQPGSPGGRSATIGLAGLLIVLVVTMPSRVRGFAEEANLEHIGVGVTRWRTADDGTRYREAGNRSSVFVPVYTRGFTLPLRAAAGAGPLYVELRLDGRTADRVRIDSDGWTTISEPSPGSRGHARFLRLDLVVGSAQETTTGPLLLIGKAVPY